MIILWIVSGMTIFWLGYFVGRISKKTSILQLVIKDDLSPLENFTIKAEGYHIDENGNRIQEAKN